MNANMRNAAISRLLKPRSVAIIGASGDPLKTSGRPAAYLLKHGYAGKIFPVNPKLDRIGVWPCYPDIASLPEVPDVAIVLLGAEHAHVAVRALAALGTPCAIVLASGYGETGRLTKMKAYDLLVQAESGLVSVSGAPGEWGRIGVSLCDINAGLSALIGIQQALMMRDLVVDDSAMSGRRIDKFTNAFLMNHNAWVYLDAGRRANNAAFNHSNPHIPAAYAAVLDIITTAFNTGNWRSVLDANKTLLEEVAPSKYK